MTEDESFENNEGYEIDNEYDVEQDDGKRRRRPPVWMRDYVV